MSTYRPEYITCAPGTPAATTVSGREGVVLVHLRADGSLIEGGYIASGRFTQAWEMALVGSDVIVTGKFSERTTLNPGRADEFTLTAARTDHQAFLIRARANGTVTWGLAFGSDTSRLDRGLSVSVAPDETVYVSGECASTATFGGLVHAWSIPPPVGMRTGYVARVTAAGIVTWVRFVSGRASGVSQVAAANDGVYFDTDANRREVSTDA